MGPHLRTEDRNASAGTHDAQHFVEQAQGKDSVLEDEERDRPVALAVAQRRFIKRGVEERRRRIAPAIPAQLTLSPVDADVAPGVTERRGGVRAAAAEVGDAVVRADPFQQALVLRMAAVAPVDVVMFGDLPVILLLRRAIKLA